MTIDININDKENNINKKIIKPTKQVENNTSKPVIKNKKVKKISKSNNKKKWPIYVLIIFLVAILGTGTYFIYKGYKLTKDIGFKLTAGDLIPSVQEPELKKDSTGKYTNALIVGIDTRENSSLLNTDTIIFVSFNYETNDVIMLSIPRDFHVEIGDTNWYARVNTVFSNAEKQEEGKGLKELQKTVEEITNQEIQYYAMVDFKAFTEIIDAVGGVIVNVENSFTDYMYPFGTGYQTVSFDAGPQEMDGETALQYSRSRHSMDNGEGSDYARAARQQKVIIALKEKIMSTQTLTSPKSIMNIISSVAENVKISEFTVEDIEAGISLASDFDNNKGEVYSFVLDPTIGNSSLVEKKAMQSGAYAIGPVLGLGQYDDIQEYLSYLMTDPLLYNEKSRILVYNTGLGYQESYKKTLELQEQFPYQNIIFAGTLYFDKENTIVYTREDNPKVHSVDLISKYLNTDITTKPEYITNNLNGEDVTILLGKQISEEDTSEI